jgi:hypothetical protein
MPSSGQSKTSRGGKEDQNDGRISDSAQEVINEKLFREMSDMRQSMDERFKIMQDSMQAGFNSMIQMFSVRDGFSPAVQWKTPPKENPDTGKKESVNLAEHYEDDISPPRKEETSSKRPERLSISYQKAALMQNAMDSSTKRIEYTKKTPDTTSIRLGNFSERDIVDWFNQWADAIAEDPGYPFSFAGSISRHIKMKMITVNDIEGGLQEINAAGMPELLKWLCVCIRPIDNISFINSLDRNVFFRSKPDFVLTERNHRDFFENIKTYNRDFCCLLDLLMDSLLETQEYPPMSAKEGEGILFVYLKKIPCDYGWAVWRDMPKEKKYKTFSEFLTEFMKICQKHRTLSEGTQKLSHVVNYKKWKTNFKGNNFDIKPFEDNRSKRFNDQRNGRTDERPGHRLSAMERRKYQSNPEEDYYYRNSADEYQDEENAFLYPDIYPQEEYFDYDQDSNSLREKDNKKIVDTDEDPEERPEEARLNALMQGPNRFGPKPSFPSNRPQTSPAAGPVPMRRPPPVPGVCFEIFKSGTCEAHKMGRCNYDHSAPALAAYVKKNQDIMDNYLANNGGNSKPRA